MKRTAMLLVVAGILAGCYTGPTYTKSGKDSDKQAMEQAMTKCDAQAKATCSPGGDSYNYCLKARAKQCMEADGWTEK
jgi:starvation-inducible outer membrane lipoprotein